MVIKLCFPLCDFPTRKLLFVCFFNLIKESKVLDVNIFRKLEFKNFILRQFLGGWCMEARAKAS